MHQTVDPEPRLEFVAAGDSLDGTEVSSDQVHTGTLDIGESVLTCGAPTDAGLRAGVIAVAAVIAAQLGRPVLLRVTDATGATDTRDLAVRPDGVVEVPSSEGIITGDEDLAPFTGPCRACGEEQEVIAASCSQCGTVEPLRVSAHGEVPLAVLATLPEEAGEEGAPEGQYDTFDEDRQVEEPNGVGVHDPSHDVPTWPLVLVMLMEHGGANVRIDAEQWPLRAESMAAVRALSLEHIRQHGAVPLGRPVRADVIDPTADPTQVIVGLDGDVTRVPDDAAPTSTRAEEPPVFPVVMAASPRKKSAPRQRPAGKRAGRGNQLLVIGSTSALAALVIAALAVPQSISPITTVLGLGTEPTGATTATPEPTPEPTPAPSSANTAPEGSAGGSAGGQSPTGGRSTASPRSGGEETEAAPHSSGAPQTTPGALAPTAPTAPVSTPGEQASTSAPSAVESSPASSSAPSAAPSASSGDDRREPQDTSAPANADQDQPRGTSSPSPAADGSITVAAGDSLSAIADQVGESVAALVEANDLRSADRIQAGQRLVVAGPAVQEAAEQADEQEAQPRSTPAPAQQDTPRIERSREEPRAAEVTPAADGSIVVAAGQTLGAIADQVGASVAALVAANDLPSADEIKAGQELVVAGPALRAAADPDTAQRPQSQQPSAPEGDVPATEAAPEQPAAGEEITVTRGDTLTEIAERTRTSVEQLAELNALPSPDLILAGQKLLIAPPVTDAPAAADDADALAPEEQPEPGAEPTTGPGAGPTPQPSAEPTTQPSAGLPGLPDLGDLVPGVVPGAAPTGEPATQPTTAPSGEPTTQPSAGPTTQPTTAPSAGPATQPTTAPSGEPTTQPTGEPTTEPSAGLPGLPDLGDLVPGVVPGAAPTGEPATQPTTAPSGEPTTQPSAGPTTQPTTQPSAGVPDLGDLVPGVVPGAKPTTQPTAESTVEPSSTPTVEPSSTPTVSPSSTPTVSPSVEPAGAPSLRAEPTAIPTSTPTDPSSATPSAAPSEVLSLWAEPTDLPAADLTSTMATVSQPLTGEGSSDGAGGLAGGIASSLLLVGSTKKLRRSRDVSAAATLRAMVTSLTRPVGAWAEGSSEQIQLSALRPGGALHSHAGDLDIAVGAIEDGESWQAAAEGTYADRWRTSLSHLRELRTGQGSTYIRFAHEWNAPWHPWRVGQEEVTPFSRAWSLYSSLRREVFPEARLVFCVARQSDGLGAAWTDAIPSADDVDLFGVDYYIASDEGARHSPDDFVAGLLQRDRFGAPVGLEAHRLHAESQGKPLVIGEWSHLSQSGPAAGFAQGLRTYVASHAGTGAGQIAYDVPLSW